MTGRVLIYDGIATNRTSLRRRLAAACYEVVQVARVGELVQRIEQDKPDLAILDLDEREGETLAACRALTAGGQTSSIPIIAISRRNDLALRIAALRAGAADLLLRPLPEELLLARLRRLLRERSGAAELEARDLTRRQLGLAEPAARFVTPGFVAIVVPDVRLGETWRQALKGYLRDHIAVLSRDEALALHGRSKQPDVFVIASRLVRPGDGTRLLSELRSGASTRYSGMLMILDPDDHPADERADAGAMALDLGANDIVTEGFDPEELALRITAQLRHKRHGDELRRSVSEGLELAVRDPLTGLYNRRYAIPHLELLASRARMRRRPFAVMVLDLDRFKQINDRCGHSAGDHVLAEVARRLRDNMRSEDLVARIGGEEFLVVLPDTDLEQTLAAAQRICALIRDTPIEIGPGARVNVTLSIGVALGQPDAKNAPSAESILRAADLALYRAKAEGRDQFNVSRSAA
jgi:two-component system cell cycle response regulator